MPREPTPVLEELPVNVTGRQLTLLQIRRISIRVARAERVGVGAVDLSEAEFSLTCAIRLLSQFHGAPELQVSESQVLRSRAWMRFVNRIAKVLEKHPTAGAEIQAALDEGRGR